MKKLILSLAICIMAISVNAQKKMWAGGQVSFLTGNTKTTVAGVTTTTKNSSYSFIPQVGYGINENFSVLLNVGMGGESHEDALGNTVKTSYFLVAPFARYAFLKGDIGNLYVDGGVQYKGGKNNNDLFVGFKPGVAFAISEKMGISASFGALGYTSTDDKAFTKTSKTGLDLNLNTFQMGFSYKF